MLGASSPGHYGNQNNFDTFFSICCRNDCGKVVTRCKFTAQEIQHLVHFVTKKKCFSNRECVFKSYSNFVRVNSLLWLRKNWKRCAKKWTTLSDRSGHGGQVSRCKRMSCLYFVLRSISIVTFIIIVWKKQ